MIARVEGTVLEKRPPSVLVDVHGIGYELAVPMSTFDKLPAAGEKVVLLTHFMVREDAQLLYGFLTEAERTAFRALIRISGIGPRIALSILSGLSVQRLAEAVSSQDTAMLTRVPGVGKKTAERLVLELKGRLTPGTVPGSAVSASPAKADIAAALIALGYSEREAEAAARKLPDDVSVNEGIRMALKGISG